MFFLMFNYDKKLIALLLSVYVQYCIIEISRDESFRDHGTVNSYGAGLMLAEMASALLLMFHWLTRASGFRAAEVALVLE